MPDTVRFVVLVKLHDTAPEKLMKLVPRLQDQLAQLSKSAPEQVFRSVTADTFGYFISSNLNASQIVAAIESPGRKFASGVEPILDGKDSVFVFEIGRDFHAGKGFTRAATWLQRN